MAKINRSLAIVIGVNEYSHIPKLKNAVSDAQELALVLEEKYGYKVLKLLDEKASKEKLDELLASLEKKIIQFDNKNIQVDESDRLLFYFAGHGFAEETQDSEEGKPAGYFMPQNAVDGNPSTWLSMQEVYQAFTNLDCHHLLMILDCCFAGRISWVLKGRNVARPRKLYQQSYDRFIKHRTEQIITSAAHDEKAQDSYRFGRRGDKNGHSPFAHLLLKVLKGNSDGGRDKFIEAILEDKVITVHELFTYLQNELGEVAEGQTPALSQPRKYDPQTREYVFLKGEYIFPLPSFNPQELIPLKLDESTNPYKGLASFETKDSQLFFGRKRLIEGSKEPNDPQYLQDGLLLKVRKHSLIVVLGVSGSGKSSLVKAGLIPALKSEEVVNQEQWYVLNPIRPGEVPITALAGAILPIKNVNLVAQLNRCNFLDNILNSKTKQERASGLNNEEKQEKEKFNILVKAWKGASPEAKLLLVVDYFEQLEKLFSGSEKQQLKNLKKDISNSLEPLIEELKKDSQSLKSLTAIVKQWNPTNQKSKLLLVIDQCEELITRCSNEAEREAFLRLLAKVLASQEISENLHIVMTLRSEFEPLIRDINKDKYQKANWQEAWQKLWQNGRFFVTSMNREELQQVIEEPAAQRALFFESPKLVNDLIDEVVQMPGALPLLSFTLSKLYLKYLKAEENRERNDRTITEADYQDIGGVTRSLTETADKTYRELLKKEKVDSSTIRDVMLRMVAISSGELARRRVPQLELVYPEPKNEQVEKVIKAFYEERLLIKGLDAEGQEYVEPVHDALIIGWKKIKHWLDEKQETFEKVSRWNQIKKWLNANLAKISLSLRLKENGSKKKGDFTEAEKPLRVSLPLQREVTNAAFKYKEVAQEENRKAVDWLWNDDPRLPLVEQIYLSPNSWLNKDELDFIESSINLKQKRFRRFIFWTVIIFTVILSAAGIAFWQAGLARTRARIATSRQISGRSQELFGKKKGLGLLLSAASFDAHDTLEARSSLLSYLQNSSRLIRILHPNSGALTKIAVSSDDSLISIGTEEGKLLFLDAQKFSTITKFSAHKAKISDIVFHPIDKKIVASSGHDNLIKLWNIENNNFSLKKVLDVHSDKVNAISFNCDGSVLASAGKDGLVVLWKIDIKSGISVQELLRFHPGKNLKIKPEKEYPIDAIEFSPTNNSLLALKSRSKVSIYDIDKQVPVYTFDTGYYIGNKLVFSPNGQFLLVYVSQDPFKKAKPRLILIDVENQKQFAETSINDSLSSLAFSTDGTSIVGGQSNGKLTIWNASNLRVHSGSLSAHSNSVTSATYSPGREIYFSVSEDKTIAVWSHFNSRSLGKKFSGPTRTARTDRPHIYRISPNAREMAMAECIQREGSEDIFSRLGLFAPKPPCSKAIVRLWNIPENRLLSRPLAVHDSQISTLDYSAEGEVLATGGEDGSIIFWDSIKGEPINKEPFQIKSPIQAITISAKGRRFAVLTKEGVILWNASLKKEKKLFEPEQFGIVTSLVINDDGSWLAIGNRKGKVYIVDFDTGEVIYQNLQTHNEKMLEISKLVFDPKGKVLAASSGKEITIWNFEEEENSFFRINMVGGSEKNVTTMKFDSSSQILASGDNGGSVMIWNARTGQRIGNALGKHSSSVSTLAFQPGKAKKIISYETNGNFTSWDIDPISWMQQICLIANRELTSNEKFQYLPSELNLDPCQHKDPQMTKSDSLQQYLEPQKLGGSSKDQTSQLIDRPDNLYEVDVTTEGFRTLSVNFMFNRNLPSRVNVRIGDLLLLKNFQKGYEFPYLYAGEKSLHFSIREKEFFINNRRVGIHVDSPKALEQPLDNTLQFIDLKIPLTSEISELLISLAPNLKYLRVDSDQINDNFICNLKQLNYLEVFLVNDQPWVSQDLDKTKGIENCELTKSIKVIRPNLKLLRKLSPQLKYFDNLQIADLSNANFKTDDFDILDLSDNLKALNLSSTNFAYKNNKEVSKLRKFTKLQSLNLAGNDIFDDSTKTFLELKNLEQLDVSSTQIGDQGLSQISYIETLRKLDVGRTHISDSGLKYIPKLSNLETLELFSTNISDQGMFEISKITTLKSLQIGQTKISDIGLGQIRFLTNVEDLDLGFMNNISDAGLIPLSHLHNLRSLRLERGITSRGMSHVAQLQNLQTLTIQNSNITDEWLLPIEKLNKLRYLYFDQKNISEQAIDRLKLALPNLEGTGL